MGKKRKHSETEVTAPKDGTAPERPKRTLMGWKDKNQVKEQVDSTVFMNKEKILVNYSRRISYRKHSDLYLWMAKWLSGSSVKFLVSAVHAMEELKLSGNNLRSSRPLLIFSANFDNEAHWKLIKEMII